MDAKTLSQAMNIPLERAQLWAGPLTEAMIRGQIDTRLRICAFLAQIGHESGDLKYVREIWGPTAAQLGYEGRKDLGNTVKGDGSKFRGRGLIQITGRVNYTACGKALGLDLVSNPTLLEQPDNAAKSAAWFWEVKGLNALADADRFTDLTRRINGGINGLEDRKKRYNLALSVIK